VLGRFLHNDVEAPGALAAVDVESVQTNWHLLGTAESIFCLSTPPNAPLPKMVGMARAPRRRLRTGGRRRPSLAPDLPSRSRAARRLEVPLYNRRRIAPDVWDTGGAE
jgi:hypothetical protein